MIIMGCHPVLILTILFLFSFSIQSNYTGSIIMTQLIQSGSIDISQYPTNTSLTLQFIIEKPVSATYIQVSDQVEPAKKELAQFSTIEYPSKATNYDLDAMWDFRTQRIIIIKKPRKDELFYVIQSYDDQRQQSFSQQDSIPYIIKLSSNCSSSQCMDCYHGHLNPSSNLFQCFCDSKYSGEACSRKIQTIPNNSNTEVQIGGYQLVHLRLMPGNDNLEISIDDGLIEVYIKLQNIKDQVASFYNSLSNYSCKFTLDLNSSIQQIKLISNHQYTLVTVVNLLNSSTNFTITLQQKKLLGKTNGGNIGIIVGVSIGSLLIIILISIIICRICYQRNKSSKQSNSGYHSLTQNKIERYFPPFYAIFLENQYSYTSKGSCQNLQHNLVLSKCSVCVDEINENDLIRILYCKHIVHSACFQEWFKKKKSCPVCQKKYYLQNTDKYYKAVVKAKYKPELKGKNLGIGIYYSSLSKMQEIDNEFQKKQQIIVSMNMKNSRNII